MGASSDWKIPAADFPAGASTKDKLGFAVKYAIMAPGVFGWPAWDYRMMDGSAHLLARVEAMQRGERETMMGCGTSLQLFKLALRQVGCLGRVDLFPDLAHPELVATIHAGPGSRQDALEGRLFVAIRQHGIREPVAEDLLDPGAVIAALERATEGERGWLEFAQNETSRQRLNSLALGPHRFEIEEVRVQNDA
jgi:hypothetical protein